MILGPTQQILCSCKFKVKEMISITVINITAKAQHSVGTHKERQRVNHRKLSKSKHQGQEKRIYVKQP